MFRPLLAGLSLRFFNLHASEGIGTLVLHVILCVFALLALAVTAAFGPVVVTLTIFLQTVRFLAIAGPLPDLSL